MLEKEDHGEWEGEYSIINIVNRIYTKTKNSRKKCIKIVNDN